jgi:hypothetical protein
MQLDLVKTFRNKYRFPGQPMIDQVLWYQMFHVLMNDHLYTPHLAALDFDSPFPQAFNCISTGPFALSIPIFLSRYFQVVANPQGYKNLTESGKNGLTYLLDRIDNDDRVSDIRHAAYILSTAFAESRDVKNIIGVATPTRMPLRQQNGDADNVYWTKAW